MGNMKRSCLALSYTRKNETKQNKKSSFRKRSLSSFIKRLNTQSGNHLIYNSSEMMSSVPLSCELEMYIYIDQNCETRLDVTFDCGNLHLK